MADTDKNIRRLETELDKVFASADRPLTMSEEAFGRVESLIADLERDRDGRIKPTQRNLRYVLKLKTELQNIIARLGRREATALTRAMEAVEDAQRNYYVKEFGKRRYEQSTIDRKMDVMRAIVSDDVADALAGTGLQTNVVRPIYEQLLRAVTSREPMSIIREELYSQLVREDGTLARYTGTYAVTAMTQYAGRHNQIATEDLGLEWFRYVGSTIETTREFCRLMTLKQYIHRSEFRDIVRGKIVINGEAHQCRLNSSGQPRGFIRGTTEDNLQQNVGGWNCRHQLVPVSEQAVPDAIKKEITEESDEDESVPDGRRRKYEQLLKSPDYSCVRYNADTGGMSAIHARHNLDKRGGKYELEVLNAGVKSGHALILGQEDSSQYCVRHTEGTWDGKPFEIAGRQTATENNILKGLKHCASKRQTAIAVIDFPNGGFSEDVLKASINRYRGLEKLGDTQFVKFERIVCVQGEQIVYDKPL